MDDKSCDEIVGIVAIAPHSMQCDGSLVGLNRIVVVADCCRRRSKFDVAIAILNVIGKYEEGQRDPLASEVKALRIKCEKKDSSVKQASQPNGPSFIVRTWNFGSAMVRWGGAGFPTRSKKEIAKLLKICQACPFLADKVCTRCGCQCIEKEQVMNKLALATEHCPDGKW